MNSDMPSSTGNTNTLIQSLPLPNNITKLCPFCNEIKPLTAFHRDNNGGSRGGRVRKCVTCIKKVRTPEVNRRTFLRVQYDMSPEEYEQMVINQRGVCAICRRAPTISRLMVDHNHITGKRRGLLCQHCNSGLGMFREDQSVLVEAILYLTTQGRGDFPRVDPHWLNTGDAKP